MSSMGKGIYLQLVSRLLKKQEEVVGSTSSSSSSPSSPTGGVRNAKAGTRVRSRPTSATIVGPTKKSRPSSAVVASSANLSSASSPTARSQQHKQADEVLRSAFHRFKAGDHTAAQKLVKKLLSKTPPASAIHFSAQLCLSLGHLRMREYEEVVKALSEVISLCGQNTNGLCDALIILAEAYSAVGLLDEALHSARLAVDVAHDKLENHQRPEVVHTKSIILLSNNPSIQIGPMLDVSTALVAAYYTLASQLFRIGYLPHAVEWYNRAANTGKDFQLDEATCKYLSKVKESAKRAQSTQGRSSIQDRVSDTGQKSSRIKHGGRGTEDDGNVNSPISVDDAISGGDIKCDINTGKKRRENIDEDDVPIDEDDSDNVDQEIDATVEENTYNFYKPRRDRLAEEAKLRSDRVIGKGAINTKNNRSIDNIDSQKEDDGNKSKKDEDGTAPTTPDATNRPSSKSKRISAARFKDKKEGAMEENNKDNKENMPTSRAPWKPSGTFNPNTKSAAEIMKEEVRAVKNKIKAAAYDNGGMNLDTMFDRIDSNKDGRIQASELEYEVKHLLPSVSRSHLRKFINSVDEDHNGWLDKQEFTHFILDTKDDVNKNNHTNIGAKKVSQTLQLSKQKSDSDFSRPKLVRTRSLPSFDDNERQASISKGKDDCTKLGGRKLSSHTKGNDKRQKKISTISSMNPLTDADGNNTATDSILNQQPLLVSTDDNDDDINDHNEEGNKHNKIMKKPSKLTDKYAVDINNAEKMYSDRSTRSVVRIQAISRGYIAQKRVSAIKQHKKFERRRKLIRVASVKIQKVGRGYISRQRVEKMRKLMNSMAIIDKRTDGVGFIAENISGSKDHISETHENQKDNSNILAEEMAQLSALREQMKKHREENPDYFMSPMQHKFGAFGTSRDLDPTNLVTMMPPTPEVEADSKVCSEEKEKCVPTSPAATSPYPASTSAPSAASVDNDESSVAVEPPTPTTLTVQGGFVIRIDAKNHETSQLSAPETPLQDVERNALGEVNSLGEDGKHDPEKFNKIFDKAMGGNFTNLVENVPPTVIVPSPKNTKTAPKPVEQEPLIITPMSMREIPISTSMSSAIEKDNDASSVLKDSSKTPTSIAVTALDEKKASADISEINHISEENKEPNQVKNEVAASITEALSRGFHENNEEKKDDFMADSSPTMEDSHVHAEIIGHESKGMNETITSVITGSSGKEHEDAGEVNRVAETDSLSTDVNNDRLAIADSSIILLSGASAFRDGPINVLDTPVDERSPVNIPIRVVERPSVYPAVSKPSTTFQPAQATAYSNVSINTNTIIAGKNEEKFLGGVLTSQPGNVVPPHNLALHKNKMLTADEMRREFDTDMHTAIKQFGADNVGGSPINVAPIKQTPIISKDVNMQLDAQSEVDDKNTRMSSIELTAQVITPTVKKKPKKRGVMFADNIEDVKVIPNTVIGEEEARSLKEIVSKKNSMSVSQGEEKENEESSITSGIGSVIGSPPLVRAEKKERRGEKSRGTIISSTLLSPASSTSSSHRRDQMVSSRSIPTQQEDKEFSNTNNDIGDSHDVGRNDMSFSDDESSTFYTNNSDYYYNESMTPNTLTTYGENTPVRFEGEDDGSYPLSSRNMSSDNDVSRFVSIKESELQNKHFESWLSSDNVQNTEQVDSG